MTVAQAIKELELLPQHAILVLNLHPDLACLFEVNKIDRIILDQSPERFYYYPEEQRPGTVSKTCVLIDVA